MNKVLSTQITLFLVLGSVFLYTKCSSSDQPSHNNILSPDEMTQWLIKAHLSEARLNNKKEKGDRPYIWLLAHEKKLLKMYGIQDSTLTRSYQYYLDQPEELESIYERVIDSLTLYEQHRLP